MRGSMRKKNTRKTSETFQKCDVPENNNELLLESLSIGKVSTCHKLSKYEEAEGLRSCTHTHTHRHTHTHAHARGFKGCLAV